MTQTYFQTGVSIQRIECDHRIKIINHPQRFIGEKHLNLKIILVFSFFEFVKIGSFVPPLEQSDRK